MRPLLRPALASLPAVRTTIILAVPCIIGATAGALTYLSSHSVPQALLASGTAAGGSAHLLGQIMGTAPERPPTSSQDNNRDDDQSDGIRQRRA